ncbi:hypothetical protein [Embleya sp. NPDC059237]|uniref:hypothetical protein n=1 Tax=Embleya sp. NPDC059237 TaxID=3346784 RepID=UPI00368229CD
MHNGICGTPHQVADRTLHHLLDLLDAATTSQPREVDIGPHRVHLDPWQDREILDMRIRSPHGGRLLLRASMIGPGVCTVLAVEVARAVGFLGSMHSGPPVVPADAVHAAGRILRNENPGRKDITVSGTRSPVEVAFGPVRVCPAGPTVRLHLPRVMHGPALELGFGPAVFGRGGVDRAVAHLVECLATNSCAAVDDA